MTNDELERRLSGLFAYPMPAHRIAAVRARIAAASTLPSPRVRIGPARDRLIRGLILAVLLTLLLGAVAVGSLELLERVASDTEPGYQAAWEHAVPLDITVQTPAGDLTIDRGYADANRVILALVMPTTDVRNVLRLTDATGREWRAFGGPGITEESGTAASLEAWSAPEPVAAGDLAFTLASHDHDGVVEWSVDFALPVVAGSTVTLEEGIEAAGITITLHSFTVTATSVHAQVTAAPLDEDRSWGTSSWTYELNGENPIGEAAHAETYLEDEEGIGRRLLAIDGGVEAPAGEWTFRIGELVGVDAEGEQVRIDGPWEFTFTLP